MSDDAQASDRVYYGLEALRGWEEFLGRARHFGEDGLWRAGAVVSSVLLAAGEEREPVAVSGELDEAGDGYAFVLYADLAVIVHADKLTDQGGNYRVTVHSLDEIADLSIATRHNYFAGTKEAPRTRGLRVTFVLSGKTITIPAQHGYGSSPLAQAGAADEALTILRERLVTRRR